MSVLLIVEPMSTEASIIHKFRSSLGLNEKDIDIYLDLLRFGASAASTIAARTNIDRTTVYAVLKRLIRKGIIVRTTKNSTSVFIALEPQVFEQQLKSEVSKKEEKLKSFQQLIPHLLHLKQTDTSRPSIQIFEGASSIISLYEQLLHSSKNQDAFLTVEKMPKKLVPYLTQDYIKQKIRLKVKSRVLVENSPNARRYKSLDHKANRSTRLVPKGQFPFETEIIIGDNNEVAIIDFQKEIVGVFIKSPSIRNTLKALFDLIWNNAK